MRGAFALVVLLTTMLLGVVVVACSSFTTGPGGSGGGGAGLDGSASDQNTPSPPLNEGGIVDAGNPLGAFCARRPSASVFCRDFDSVTMAAEGWGRTKTSQNISLIDSERSAPQAARFRFEENEDKDNARVASLEALMLAGGAIDFDFDVHFVKPLWNNTTHTKIGIASIISERGGAAQPYEIFVVVEKNGFSLITHLPNEAAVTSTSSWPYDRWVHVTLRIGTPLTSGLPIQLLLDNSVALTTSPPYQPVSSFDGTYVGIGLLDLYPPSPQFDIRFDNVELTPK